ncbi:Decarboxylase orsB [Colletotrichum viniferum]|nr:Decarboxylase orsB [Colletotrichum viniferum]
MRIVAAEEHFSSTAFDGQLPAHHPGFDRPVSQLRDIGAGRIADMNKRGISTQLHEAVKKHPARFAAFVCLPTAHPERAVEEFKRCIRELGFKGALINNTVDGEFLDNRKYFPIFEAAADLGVPIYIHPSFPSAKAHDVLFSGDTISPEAAFMVSTGA